MVRRIGVISDTHISGPTRHLPPALWRAFVGVDLILHAGDLTTLEVLHELEALCPVHAVSGNCDPPEVTDHLPSKTIVAVECVRIGLTHGHLGRGATTPERAKRAFSDVQCVVFGHSHEPLCERDSQVLLFNPGSAVERRHQPRTSCGLLYVDGSSVRGEVIPL